MKRILMVHPRLRPPGGGEGVAAWLLHGLLENRHYRVELATSIAPEFEALDGFFGTRLAEQAGSLPVHLAPRSLGRVLRGLRVFGVRAAAAEIAVLERWVRSLARRGGPYDLYLSTSNEWVFPEDAPVVCYVHYPRHHPVRGEGEVRSFHQVPGFLAGYRRICDAIGGHDPVRLAAAAAHANSAWTAERYREVYGTDARVVYPPAIRRGPEGLAWSERASSIVLLGRISREKRILEMIRVVEQVRERLGEVPERPCLRILGSWDCDAGYRQAIADLSARHSTWLQVCAGLPRCELEKALGSSRYGVHGMRDEHFGMAVAELQSAGCVTFVPVSGGPREIVGEESRQLYASDGELVEKLARVLGDSALQLELHQRARARQELFSIRRFLDEMLVRVDESIAAGRH